MAPQKINVKERFSDGEIDLSMSDLQDVPVKEIATFKKAFSLDLSNNNLKVLPLTFAGLTHLTKLDLSKNQLKELPENFGDLIKLKYLDLYQNQLEYLPLSFSKLKALKWLDLKDNPLVPKVAKVAGPCLDAKECQTCAKDVVNFFAQLQDQIASDLENRQKHRQKQLEINQQKQMDTKKAQKKKEKTKTKKPQNGPTIKEHVSKPSKKNKSKQEAKPSSESSSTSSVISNVFVVIFLLFFTLFVLTSINCKCTELVGKSIADFYVKSVDAMPANLQGYYVVAGSYFKLAHAKTGNVTLSVVDIVAKSINHENFASALNFLSELKENVSSKIQKVFS